MSQESSQDWRIELYDGYLDGATFQFKKFASTETSDHVHCDFCWQKITDLKIEGADIEGYCTICPEIGQEIWLCKKCFHDFNKRFNFKLK